MSDTTVRRATLDDILVGSRELRMLRAQEDMLASQVRPLISPALAGITALGALVLAGTAALGSMDWTPTLVTFAVAVLLGVRAVLSLSARRAARPALAEVRRRIRAQAAADRADAVAAAAAYYGVTGLLVSDISFEVGDIAELLVRRAGSPLQVQAGFFRPDHPLTLSVDGSELRPARQP